MVYRKRVNIARQHIITLNVLFTQLFVLAEGLVVGSASSPVTQEPKFQRRILELRSVSKVDVLRRECLKNFHVPRRLANGAAAFRRHLTNVRSTSSSTVLPDWAPKRLRLSQIQLRWCTGIFLGAFGTYLIYSPKWFFTSIMTLIMLIVQLEYFSMVKSTGVEPASKTGHLAGVTFFLVGAYYPALHELILPGSITFLMTWLLLFKKSISSIREISTTLLGVIYFGYLPSFLMRLRYEFGPALTETLFHQYGSSLLGLDWLFKGRSYGAMVLWWTICSIVCADVGAYFFGKTFGKHKLAEVCKAAGAASPNKTVEGAIGGWILCTAFFTLGSYLMQWPNWKVTGPLYGLMVAVLGLVGDLMASMMKRDANFKDSGGVLPGHGGLIDRFDSYILSGPLCYFALKLIMQQTVLTQPR